MNREPVSPEDPDLTAYALGEMNSARKAEFEERLKLSPEAQVELKSISEMMSMLSNDLRCEWESRVAPPIMVSEPVDSDDLDLTAFALGEMSAAEKAEFEVRLESSPRAKRELESMSEIMSMLSTGLKNEWEREMAPPVLQLVEEDAEVKALREQVIVPVTFRESKKMFGALAAAVAVMLVAFGVSNVDQKGEKHALVAAAPLNSVDSSPAVHIPQLFLADEIDDIDSLVLADTAVDSPVIEEVSYPENAEIDTTYLDSVSIVPASFSPKSEAAPRVDSYLPPVADEDAKTTQVDLRSGKTFASTNAEGSRVLVRGFVSMDGERSIKSFHPVAMSGNPVGESDLRILARMRSLQNELAAVVSSMPEGSAERAKLQELLSHSREIGNELKHEFSQ